VSLGGGMNGVWGGGGTLSTGPHRCVEFKHKCLGGGGTEHWAIKNDFGVWCLFLPDNPDGSYAIPHRWEGGCPWC
jgi:hypothetical protein